MSSGRRIVFFVMGLLLFSSSVLPATEAARSPEDITVKLPRLSGTVESMVEQIQRTAPVEFIVATELLNRPVQFPVARMNLRSFVEKLAAKLGAGFILTGPDSRGHFRVLIAPQKAPAQTQRSTQYRNIRDASTFTRPVPARQPIRSRPVVAPRARNKRSLREEKSRTRSFPTAGSLQMAPPTDTRTRSRKTESRKP